MTRLVISRHGRHQPMRELKHTYGLAQAADLQEHTLKQMHLPWQAHAGAYLLCEVGDCGVAGICLGPERGSCPGSCDCVGRNILLGH